MPRVLVIDDSAASRNHVCRLLEQQGWDVASADTAERGAAAVMNDPPDIVIADLWMPGLSGIQLCRLLHADPVGSGVPLILMSATLDRRSRYWALQSGASAAIEKSQLDGLHELLSSLVKPRPCGGQDAAARQVTAGSVPVRMSQLLDTALFEAMLAKELSGLALASELKAFFEGLVALLGQVLSYHWLALRVNTPDEVRGYFHVPVKQKNAALAEAAALVEIELERSNQADPFVLCDERGLDSGADTVPVVHAIRVRDVEVGRIAVRLQPATKFDDYDLLAFVSREIAPSLRSAVLAEQTRHMATSDMLTKLHNRRSAFDVLSQAVAASLRYGLALSVAVIDVDRFKNVNDTYGHHVGDMALQQIANVLRCATRKADFPARWGGEEFLLIMPSTGAAGARVCAERIRMAIARTPVSLENETPLALTASIGVATFESGESDMDLVNRADRALYAAKERGRNRVEVA
jgi:two-component system, cell cycle response regulator